VTLTSAGRDAIATADTILLRPPPAVSSLRADDLRELTVLLERLIETDEPDGSPLQ